MGCLQTRPHPARSLLALALLATVLGPPADAASTARTDETHTTEVDEPWEQRVVAVLRWGRQAPRPAGALADRLARLGEPAVGALLDAARTGRLPTEPGEASRDLVLTDEELAQVHDAVRRLGRGCVLPLAADALLAGPLASRHEIRRALLGLELTGRADDLELALALVAIGSDQDAGGLALQRDLERTVEAIARRDADTLGVLAERLEHAGESSACSLVRGVAAAGRPGTAMTLVDLLDSQPHRAALLLSELARIAPTTPRPLDLRIVPEVRERLGDRNASVARAAVTALGRLEDFGSVPAMIDLLDSEDRGLADSALQALRRLSGGLPYRGDPAIWTAWMEREERWFEHRLPELTSELGSSQPGRVIAALREIAGHRYRRHELAALVAPVLEHESPAVRRCACATLAALGSTVGTARLIERLDDEVPEVALAARSSLTQVIGRDLPEGRPDRLRALGVAD